MIGAIIGGAAGLVGSGIQIYQGMQERKRAEQAAKNAQAKLAAAEETNMMESLKVTDLTGQKFDADAGHTAKAIQAAQEMGGGFAGISGIVEAGRTANLQTAQQQSQLNYQRDKTVLGTAQDIEANRFDIETGLAYDEFTGAKKTEENAQKRTQAGVSGAFKGAGQLAAGVIGQVKGNEWLEQNW